ncbi:hypothetical protein [Paractinoplanes toevensis]|uniref:Alanine-rich protein n=1 Tax=Paractinoplanes toevensis TaxID=571911 RepID=A0A919TBN4_9ACTN|nr:hypothetical protein [Actinoplanes toevensis]GIM91151.1 hypothetical protein Ato02nite_029440 [Actinoplanes toevensis]
MVSGHAYPWDVLGDPGFLSRAPRRVTLAATYHSTRAATPMHPEHRIVDARWAALYRPVRPSAWKGQDLRPLAPSWVSSPDSFGEAATILKRAGHEVTAWIVLTHNTRLGTRRPDVAVVNCFGEPYPYALCPAHAEVRDHAATLAAEAVHDLDLDGVSLEGCGQMGVTHLGHHEKTDGAWSPATARLLSICCCTACQQAWTADGLDPAEVVAALRAGTRSGDVPSASRAGTPSGEMLSALLAVRHRHTDLLRAQVLAALPASLPVTLHAHPDPWATGPSPGLTASAASDVDALLVPCWPLSSEELVRQAVSHGRPVDAYVTLLHPMDPDALAPHVQALKAAGASRFSLYHLGLAPAWRQDLFAAIAAAVA